jgi:imidazolonepropionase-like amidohydrolase
VRPRPRAAGALVAACALAATALSLHAQESTSGAAGSGAVRRFLAPPAQVVAIRAGRLFDARSGRMSTGQTILIRGDKIAEVGANLNVPPDARVIDLGDATVLPGMIDVHVHVNVGGNEGARAPAERAYVALASAQTDLLAGFTTVADMDSRGGFNTVDLRDAINAGLVLGPRMQVVGQSLNIRASNAYSDSDSGRFYSEFTEGKNVNSPWLARAAVREAKLHGVDWVKIYTSQDFVGPYHLFTPEGELITTPSLTREEVEAITDEAHRLGLKVACHTYGGEGMRSCIEAGVDAPTHLLELDDAGIRTLLQRKAAIRLHARRSDLSGKGRPARQRRQALAAVARGASFQTRAQGRRANRIRQRRDIRDHSARRASESVRVLREMGHDARASTTDFVPRGRDDAELPLGEADRQPRARQARRRDCGRGRPAARRRRDAARALRDEGRPRRARRDQQALAARRVRADATYATRVTSPPRPAARNRRAADLPRIQLADLLQSRHSL